LFSSTTYFKSRALLNNIAPHSLLWHLRLPWLAYGRAPVAETIDGGIDEIEGSEPCAKVDGPAGCKGAVVFGAVLDPPEWKATPFDVSAAVAASQWKPSSNALGMACAAIPWYTDPSSRGGSKGSNDVFKF
jgi:hypothetical protein